MIAKKVNPKKEPKKRKPKSESSGQQTLDIKVTQSNLGKACQKYLRLQATEQKAVTSRIGQRDVILDAMEKENKLIIHVGPSTFRHNIKKAKRELLVSSK